MRIRLFLLVQFLQGEVEYQSDWGQSTDNPEEPMDVITVVLIVFVVLELSNVLMLYLAPGTRRGNSIGIFNAYEKSKADPEIYALLTYLVNWVAGTKLIFIFLLTGILITGSEETKLFSIIALIFSIMTFYFRLYPGICRMDDAGQITPPGYSRTLGRIIAGFLVIFTAAVIIYLVNQGT